MCTTERARARWIFVTTTSRSRSVTAGIFLPAAVEIEPRQRTRGSFLQEFIAPRETIPESGSILTWNLPIVTLRHSFVIVSRERASLSAKAHKARMRYRDITGIVKQTLLRAHAPSRRVCVTPPCRRYPGVRRP